MAHLKAITLRSVGVYTSIRDSKELYVLLALRLCFNHYIEDIKKAVKEGVAHSSIVDDELAHEQRQSALRRWLKNMGVGEMHYKSATIRDLMVAVCGTDARVIENGLPPTSNIQLSAYQLASAMYTGVSPTESNTLRAPFLAGSRTNTLGG